MKKTRTVALVDFFDWNRGGHFRVLYRVMVESLLAAGHNVIAACYYPAELDRWAENEGGPYRARLKATRFPTHDMAKDWWRREHVWEKRLIPKLFGLRERRVKKRLEQYQHDYFDNIAKTQGWKIDAMFFPSLTDYFLLPQSSLPWRHLPMGGLWLAPASYIHLGVAVTAVPLPPSILNSVRNESSVEIICLHDECLLDEFKRLFPKQQIMFWPDASDELAPNRDHPLRTEIIRRAKGRFTVASVGVMDRRKGIMTLLRAAKHMPDCFFIFAGPDVNTGSFSEEERAQFEAAIRNCPENCFFHIERIPNDDDFNFFIDVADSLYIAYLGFTQSSNLLTKAAAQCKPVIVSERPGCLKERNRLYNLGLEIPEGSVQATIKAITTLKQQRDEGTLHTGRRYAEFMKVHSRAAMAQVLLDVVEKLCAIRR
jgi:glycosyltransferase involved in cell wall biosynthesis